MRQIVNRRTFDEITIACRAVYDATRAGSIAADEAAELEARADALLRAAGICYLTEALPPEPNLPSGAKSPAAEFSEAYVALQHLRSELQVALRELLHAKLAAKRYDQAAAICLAIYGLSPDPTASGVKQVREAAARLFADKKWDEGRTLLNSLGSAPENLEPYYFSYIQEMLGGSTQAYYDLNAQIDVTHMMAFHHCFVGDSPVPANIMQLWSSLRMRLRRA